MAEMIPAKVHQDIEDIGKAVNTDAIITPRYGAPFKSLPMIAREIYADVLDLRTNKADKIDVDAALSTKAPQATTYTKAEVDTTFAAYVGGRKAYTTLALAQADQANLAANTVVEVTNDGANNGTYQWNGTTLTKSDYDPLTQAKTFATAEAEAAEASANQYTDDKTQTEKYNSTQYVYSIDDAAGNSALGIKPDGTVDIPKLSGSASSVLKNLKIGTDDSFIHIGDSLTGAYYVAEDKAYISQLSQLSPFRHINYGWSGNDAIELQYRVLSNLPLLAATLQNQKPRFAFIATLANDKYMTDVDITYFQENLRRLIDVVLSHGVEPILVSEFLATSTQHQAIKSVSAEYQCAFISGDILNRQVGFYTGGELFHQWHTGTRTGGLWWIPMLELVKQQRPQRTIKIFRKRPTFTAVTDADLLFKSVLDKAKKWKEIQVGHWSLTNEYKYDEINSLGSGDLVFTSHADEYLKIQNKENVSFSDYALIEIGLDAQTQYLNDVKINLGLSTTVQAFVRNNNDVSKVLTRPSVPSDSNYQANWNNNRGAWRSVTVSGSVITIAKADLINSMVGNRIYLMLKGAFNLNDLSVEYSADRYETMPRIQQKKQPRLGDNLLTQPLLDSASLSGWTTNGTVNTLIPIDVSNAPRKPNANTPVDGVAILNSSNSITQSITLPSKDYARKFIIEVWGRDFPKAFLDTTNPKYSSLDTSQIVVRNGTNVAPINKNTLELKTLKLETWTETNTPVYGGADHFDYACLQWRPIQFEIEVQPFETKLTIRLSGTDGDIQVAKVLVNEVV